MRHRHEIVSKLMYRQDQQKRNRKLQSVQKVVPRIIRAIQYRPCVCPFRSCQRSRDKCHDKQAYLYQYRSFLLIHSPSCQSSIGSLQSAVSILFCLLLFGVYYVVVLAQVIAYSLLETGDWLPETDLASSSAVVVV